MVEKQNASKNWFSAGIITVANAAKAISEESSLQAVIKFQFICSN
jgi:hypothetical protein